jgi:hypothetical protein
MILRESPDNVTLNGVTKSWANRDAVCFSMIDGICVYESYSSKPGSHDFLIAALFHIFQGGEKAIKEVGADGVMVKGGANESNKQKLQPLFDSISSGKGGFNRNTCMKIVPGLIHGRLWTKEPKVVSFWNEMSVLKNLKSEIIDFIKIFDDPKNFIYDTDMGQLSYDRFLGKSDNNIVFQKFDQATVHKMAPGPEKSFIQKQRMSGSKFGSFSPYYLNAQNRAKINTSESFSFANWLKNN